MTKEEFVKKLTDSVKVGDVFDNPGGGTSTIECIDTSENGFIKYKRGKNFRPKIKFESMHDAYSQFPNGFSTNDLKNFNPEVFKLEAGGHGCNCTFLMMMLKQMGIVKQIEGSMKPKDLPFRVKINKQ